MDSIDSRYFEIFENIEAEFDEYSELLSAVEIMTDNKLYLYYQNKQNQIKNIATMFKKYKNIMQEKKLAEELLIIENREVEKNSIKENILGLEKEAYELFEQLKLSYLENGKIEKQNVKIEITSKTNDEEFLQDFISVIKNFVNQNDYKIKDEQEKKLNYSCHIVGDNVFEKLKFFNGTIKKVQKNIESVLTIVVLLEKIDEIEFNENDVVIETSKSSGAGGQHINKTESAVRLIHLPTGITCECQDERSQLKNKERALEMLKLKIQQKTKENQEKYIKNQRNLLKNAIFSDTAVFVFDYDKNKVICSQNKKAYPINEILSGNLKQIASDLKI